MDEHAETGEIFRRPLAAQRVLLSSLARVPHAANSNELKDLHRDCVVVTSTTSHRHQAVPFS